jgi:hypothetical protein
LRDVSAAAYAKWNIVYLPRQGRVLFRTQRRPAIREVSLGRFDGSCRTPVKALDIDAALAGEVTARFGDYAPAHNRALLERTMAPLAAALPPGTVAQLADHAIARPRAPREARSCRDAGAPSVECRRRMAWRGVAKADSARLSPPSVPGRVDGQSLRTRGCIVCESLVDSEMGLQRAADPHVRQPAGPRHNQFEARAR